MSFLSSGCRAGRGWEGTLHELSFVGRPCGLSRMSKPSGWPCFDEVVQPTYAVPLVMRPHWNCSLVVRADPSLV